MKVKNLKPGCSVVLGRGEVSIDGRYIGNTPKFDLRMSKAGKLRVEFDCDDISQENIQMFFTCDAGRVSFKARNVVGPNIDISIPRVEFKRQWSLKTADNWMALRFTGKAVAVNGTLLEYTYPTIFQVTQ
ncbi:hypothetical protein ABDF71_21830 [Ochrobactrum sp. WV_118_8]